MLMLGEILVKDRLITGEQFLEALRYRKANDVSLARALVALGYVKDQDITSALSRKYGVPTITLEEVAVEASVIAILPVETARKYQILPVRRTGGTLTLAMVDPTNVFAMDDVHFMTGYNIEVVLASEGSMEQAIDNYYGTVAAPEGPRREDHGRPSPPVHRPGKSTPDPSFSALEDAVGQNPVDPGAWMQLADAYRVAEEYELARVAYRQATRFGPDEPEAHWGLAVSLLSLERGAEAVAPAREAVRLRPSNPQGHYCLGRALAAQGHLHLAVEHFRETERLAPGWPQALSAQGRALYQMGQNRAAADCLEASLRLDPDQPVLWTMLGLTLGVVGEWTKAANALETAVFARPDDGWGWALLGKTRRKLGALHDAHGALTKAVRLGYDQAWAWRELGETAKAVGDLEGAARAQHQLRRRDQRLARKPGKKIAARSGRQLGLFGAPSA